MNDGVASIVTPALNVATGRVAVEVERISFSTATPPTIQGTNAIGEELTASGSWASYQWFANGEAIAGATASAFVITPEQIGATISLVVGTSAGGLVASAGLPPTTVPLFIFVGESNAEGFGDIDDAAPEDLEPHEKLFILDNVNLDGFEPLQIGTNNHNGHVGFPGHYGVDLQLGHIVDSGRFGPDTCYMVQTAIGGTTFSDWAEGDSSGLWANFVERVTTAIDLLAADGKAVTPYVFYSLGLNDINEGMLPGPWKTAQLELINRIKGILPGALIVVTKFRPQDFGGVDGFNQKLHEIAAAEANVATIYADRDNWAPGDIHRDYLGHKIWAESAVDTWFSLSGLVRSTAPTFDPVEGVGDDSVVITGVGEVQYTINGSDPLPGIAYAAPVAITAPTTIQARSVEALKVSSKIVQAEFADIEHGTDLVDFAGSLGAWEPYSAATLTPGAGKLHVVPGVAGAGASLAVTVTPGFEYQVEVELENITADAVDVAIYDNIFDDRWVFNNLTDKEGRRTYRFTPTETPIRIRVTGVAGTFDIVAARLRTVDAADVATGVNLLTYSEELDHADWSVFGTDVPTADYAAAPDSTTTAERFNWSQAGNPFRYHDASVTPGPFTFSFYYKAVSGTPTFAARDLYSGAVDTFTADSTWQRGELQFTAGGANARVGLDFRDTYGSSTTGDVLIWGCQLEPGTSAGIYTKTTDTPVLP